MEFFAEQNLKKIGATLTASLILTVSIFWIMQWLIDVGDVKLKTDSFRIADVTMPERELELMACLLYTSPSPRDRQKSRMPSSA